MFNNNTTYLSRMDLRTLLRRRMIFHTFPCSVFIFNSVSLIFDKHWNPRNQNSWLHSDSAKNCLDNSDRNWISLKKKILCQRKGCFRALKLCFISAWAMLTKKSIFLALPILFIYIYVYFFRFFNDVFLLELEWT